MLKAFFNLTVAYFIIFHAVYHVCLSLHYVGLTNK